MKHGDAHRDGVLARLPRVAQTVQTDGDLRVVPVVVLVAAIVAVFTAAVVAASVRQLQVLCGQTDTAWVSYHGKKRQHSLLLLFATFGEKHAGVASTEEFRQEFPSSAALPPIPPLTSE